MGFKTMALYCLHKSKKPFVRLAWKDSTVKDVVDSAIGMFIVLAIFAAMWFIGSVLYPSKPCWKCLEEGQHCYGHNDD